MRTSIKALIGLSIAAAAGFATPAYADAPVTYIGGCDTSITTPGANACDGYYTNNILSGATADLTATALSHLGITWDGTQANWDALVNAGYGGLTTLSGAGNNELAFPTTLYGVNVIGIHFGNVAGDYGNVSVFLRYDFGSTGADHITLNNTQGFSNYAIWAGGVPEPATWAMLLLGVGMIGTSMRRRRKQSGSLVLA